MSLKQMKPVGAKKKTVDLRNDFYVFDTETTELSPMVHKLVFGVLYGYNYMRVFSTPEEFKELLKDKRFQKKTIFAHNAEFDLLATFGNIIMNIDDTAIFNGKFISCKWGTTTFADSMNIFPTSVAKLGEILGDNKIDNEKVKTEGLTKSNMNLDDIVYCIKDCSIVWDSLLKMFLKIGAIKITIGSVALYDFRKNFLDSTISYNEHTDKFFDSYFGGRTEAFKIGRVDCSVYDVNSEYPHAMVNCIFPDPRTLKCETKVDLKYFNYLLGRYEGLVKCKVYHKPHYFGFLPYRDESNNKLLFPTGTFSGCWNFNEIRFALENNIIEILEITEIVYSNPIESPFIKFVETYYKHRLSTSNEFEKLLDKLLMNNMYGKLAQRLKYKTQYHDQIPYEIIEELQKCEKYYKLKMFSSRRNDCYLETENEEMKNSFFSIAVFPSYITSFARVHLLKNGLLPNIKNKVCYCDTDSVFLEGEFIGLVGNELGKFKKEDKKVVEIRGLKNYIMASKDGKETKIIKGVGKRAKQIGENTYKETKYFKTKEALRRGVESGDIKTVIKEITNKYDKRIVLNDGNTKPIEL